MLLTPPTSAAWLGASGVLPEDYPRSPWDQIVPDGTVTKALELSGQSNLLFLRNSVTGAVEARPRDGHGIVLNSALHAND